MTAPLFTIEGQDGASLAVYEATNGKAVVLVTVECGHPSHGVKLSPVQMIELGLWLRRQGITMGMALAHQAGDDFERSMNGIRDQLAEKAEIPRRRLEAMSRPDFERMADRTYTEPLPPMDREAYLQAMTLEVERAADRERTIPLTGDIVYRFYERGQTVAPDPLEVEQILADLTAEAQAKPFRGTYTSDPRIKPAALSLHPVFVDRPEPCAPGEHEFSCICGQPVDGHSAPHFVVGVGCDLCLRTVAEIEQTQALPYDGPPMCPVDEHALVCHCGSDMDTVDGMGSHDGTHGPTLMGCARCEATPEELAEQAREIAREVES
jgi:hypothetical protein